MIFGSEEWPLRPSSLKKLLTCPGQYYLDAILQINDEKAGLHTGSVVHKGVEVFHRTPGDPLTRKEEAVAAAHAAIPTFPLADQEKVFRWLAAYANDKANIDADIPYIEQQVFYRIPIDGQPDIVIRGTLDQIRRGKDGRLTIWDLKTGSYMNPAQIVDESQVQQAAYVLAARQTLGIEVFPGGIIYAAGYDKPRGQRFLPLGVDVDDCEAIMEVVKQKVLDIRSGRRDFTPSAAACGWCKHRTFPACSTTHRSLA